MFAILNDSIRLRTEMITSIWINIHKLKEEGEDFEERNRENFWVSLSA